MKYVLKADSQLRFLALLLVAVLFLLVSTMADASQIRIAVVDSGLRPEYVSHLCENSSYSLVPGQRVDKEIISRHGTNVVGLINKYAEDADYCITMIKVFTDNPIDPISRFTKALELLATEKYDIVNVSANGLGYYERERNAVVALLNRGVIVVAAAGNESKNLDVFCNSYPACYDPRIVVVGAIRPDRTLVPSSNYALNMRNLIYELGEDQQAGGVILTGTSQATAITTGKLVKFLHRIKGRGRKVQDASSIDTGKIAEALYKQSDIDRYLLPWERSLERYVPQEINVIGGVVIPVYRAVASGTLTLQYNF